MIRSANALRLFATLLVVWLLLGATLAPAMLALGLVASALVAWLFAQAPSVLSGIIRPAQALAGGVGFVLAFLAALLRANLQLARVVLSPSLPIRPAIVRAHTRLTHPVARLLLANAITLTPGTLSVELLGENLYVHWVVAPGADDETATRAIVAGFERHLEKIYG